MKLFGNTHSAKASGLPEEDTVPVPTDKTRPRDDAGQADQIIDDAYDEADAAYEDEYDEDYDYDEYDEDYDDDYDDEYDEEDEDYGEDGKKRMSTTKKVLIIGLSVLLVVLIGCGLFVNYLLNLINYQKADSDYFKTVSTIEEMPTEEPIDSELEAIDEAELAATLEATPEELEMWNNQIKDITSDSSTYEVPISEDVYNILLVGTDNRDEGGVGRSDAMILVSINQKSKTIYLTSFLRDCYVHVPGYGNTKLNHSYAYGGPALLMETLEENFKVHVDKYVAVDFYSFMDVIDVLGGVWLYVTDEEMEVTNKYIWSMNKLMGVEWSEDYLWSSGWKYLNGKQALCYARNRYTGNDYERTQRQRNIINQIINGCLESSPATLVSLAQVILPQITTDLEKTQVLNYAANIAAYLDYDIQQQQIPASGTYQGAMINGMSVISLDLDDNIAYLQSTIYAGTPYGTPLPEPLPEPEPEETAAPTGSTSTSGTGNTGAIAPPSPSPTKSTGTTATPKPSASTGNSGATTSPAPSDEVHGGDYEVTGDD